MKSIQELRREVEKLKKENSALSKEYDRIWDVLRTFPLTEQEIEYIGFKTIEEINEE